MRLSCEKTDRSTYIAGLTDAQLQHELMFYMVLLEVLTCGIQHIEDEEKEGYTIAWPLEETVSYYNSLVFESVQRLESVKNSNGRTGRENESR